MLKFCTTFVLIHCMSLHLLEKPQIRVLIEFIERLHLSTVTFPQVGPVDDIKVVLGDKTSLKGSQCSKLDLEHV